MKAFIIVSMFLYAGNAVADFLMANGKPRQPIPKSAGIFAFLVQISLFIWGGYLIA